MNIGYLSEHPAEYARLLRACKTLDELKKFLRHWKSLAPDAAAIVEKMDETQFQEFREGLRKESAGDFAGVEWQNRFAEVMLPKVMFLVSMVADQFGVPWGTAFIRLKEEGYIRESNGVHIWTAKGEPE